MPEAKTSIRSGEAIVDAGDEPEAVIEAAVGSERLTRLPGVGVVAAVSIKPDPTALPGGGAAQKLIDGGTYFVILACVAGALLGLAQWALGSRTSNYSQADNGKSKFVACVIAAFLTGALAAIINFFVSAGGAVK